MFSVGDPVHNQMGWVGVVVQVDDMNAIVDWNNGESGSYPRDEDAIDGGVLKHL